MATSERTHRKEGGLDMTALQEGIWLGRHQGREVQTIGDRVVVNPRFRLAALRDVDGNVIETVRLSLEVCGCGYSYARPGVGYAGPDGWYCKRCGQLHTFDKKDAASAHVGSADLKPDPCRVRAFDKRIKVCLDWSTPEDLEAGA